MTVATFAQLKTEIAAVAKRSDLTSEIPNFIARAENRMFRLLRVRAMEAQGRIIWKANINIAASGVAGTANAITLSPDTAATEYSFADAYVFTAEDTNTAAATVDVSSLGAQTVKKIAEGIKADMSAGDIREGAAYRIYYDGTDFLLAPEGGALLPGDFISLRSRYVDAASKRLEYIDPGQFWNMIAVGEVGTPRAVTIEGDWLITAPFVDATYVSRIDYYRRLAALSADSDTNALLTHSHEVYLYGALLELAQAKKLHDEALGWSIRFDDAIEDLNRTARRAHYPPASAVRSEVPVT